MQNERTWKRIREQLELKLPVRVQCRETSDVEWMELTRLTNVTPFGPGFTLHRPIVKGRLASKQNKLTVYGAVRGHTEGSHGIPRVHL